MRDNLVHIAWTAAPLSAEQQMVMRHIAVLFLRREDPSVDHIDFTHELIEGRLYRKSRGLFVTIVGTFFHADLGTVRGMRWTSDFLLPAGAEHQVFGDDTITVAHRYGPHGFDASVVDRTLAATTEASLLPAQET